MDGLIKTLENIQWNEFIDKQEEFNKVIYLVEKNIKILIHDIKNSDNIKVSMPFFESLAKIQFILSNLLFVQDIDMSMSLKTFIHDFERLDDIDLVKYMYNQICNENYSI